MNHTPGPWDVDDSGTVTGKGGAHIAVVSSLDDFPCADPDSMHPEQLEDIEKEYQTNGRLIAAAPDLLAVAQLVVQATVGNIPPGIVHAAREAIAKVEAAGRSRT